MTSFAPASVFFDSWTRDVLHGEAPELWPVGRGFESVEIGPGLVCLVGGAPGAGKTALVMQWTIDALRGDTSLRAVVCNVEMHPRTLLDRQLARLSGVCAGWIRHRSLQGQESRIRAGLEELGRIADRIAFHTGPPSLAAIAQSADAFGARLLVLDYVQRFVLGTGDPAADRRGELDSIMSFARKFADAGLAVLIVSAVSRQKGNGGSNYSGLNLASFRGTSELEYGGDSCWILERESDDSAAPMRLNCVKNRHGDTASLLVHFDRMRQSFTVAGPGGPRTPVDVPYVDSYADDPNDEPF